MIVAIYGSYYLPDPPIPGWNPKLKSNFKTFQKTCHAIGRHFAKRRFGIVVTSENNTTADYYVVRGFVEEWNSCVDEPKDDEVCLLVMAERPRPVFQDFLSKHPSLFRCLDVPAEMTRFDRHLTGLRASDSVVIVGGNDHTSQIASVAKAFERPLYPIGTFGLAGEILLQGMLEKNRSYNQLLSANEQSISKVFLELIKDPETESRPAIPADDIRNLPMVSQDAANTISDIVIICALPLELDSLLSIGSENLLPIGKKWDKLSVPHDPQTYHSSHWQSASGKRLRVIAAAPSEMGPVASAALAAKIILNFRPKLVAITGIAAGANPEVQDFGDVLVPNETFDLGSAKASEAESGIKFEHNPNSLSINPRLLGLLVEWNRSGQQHFGDIAQSWPGTPPRTSLKMHIGPMATIPVVLNATGPLDELKRINRKLIGLEMEAHAVHRACNKTIEPSPDFLCMKSICDFAASKADSWQKYASFTSSRMLYLFLIHQWDNLYPLE